MRPLLDPECEQGLIAAARDDPQALARLYEQYFPRVYAYVAYRLARTQEIEDVVADVFLKVVAALRQGSFTWRHAGSFGGWVFRIAHNTVTDRQRAYLQHPATVPLDDLPDLVSSASQPDDMLVRKEQFAQLRRLLTTLSPRRQEVLTLKFFGGLPNIEIAAILDLDERTVASHLCRGLADLQRKYQAETLVE